MKCIDFDKKLGEYVEQWIAANRARYKNPDEMEEQMPEVYLRWLNHPAQWLGGKTPGIWFGQYGDPDELLAMMRAYHEQDVPMPDLLLSRVVELGEASVDGLIRMAREDARCLQVTALNLLLEIGSARACPLCVRLIREEEASSELTDTAAELLRSLGPSVVPALLEAMPDASEAASESFLDVLCNFPGDERIYEYARRAFLQRPERRALFASYLAKLGDERALEPLYQALELTELNYLDYIEITGAIEALGGEVQSTREFVGDPYYESLKRMQ